MTPDTVLTVGKEALELTTVIVALVLLPALVVGLIVGVFQAATQINEMTLSFIPKLLATFVVLIFAGPWLLQMLVGYIKRLFEQIPSLIG